MLASHRSRAVFDSNVSSDWNQRQIAIECGGGTMGLSRHRADHCRRASAKNRSPDRLTGTVLVTAMRRSLVPSYRNCTISEQVMAIECSARVQCHSARCTSGGASFTPTPPPLNFFADNRESTFKAMPCPIAFLRGRHPSP